MSRTWSRRSPLSLGVLLLASTTAACFRYAEVPIASLRPGHQVRAQLTGSAVERLRNGGHGEARLLDDFSLTGRIERAPSDSLVFAIEVAPPDATQRTMRELATVALTRGEVRRAELRTLDRKKSFLTGAAISAAAVLFAVYAVKRGGEGSGTTSQPTSPPEIRIPLGMHLRFR